MTQRDRDLTRFLLRLLVRNCRVRLSDGEWPAVLRLAQRNNVLLRVASSLEQRGVALPPCFAQPVAQSRARSDAALGLVARVDQACERRGIAHAFLKVAEHYPDAGRDVDLLIAPYASGADLMRLGDDITPPVQRNRLAGTTTHPVPDGSTTLDIHHGRLGLLGEHRRYAASLLRRRRRVSIGGVSCVVPAPQDQLLLQALRHLQGRPRLRLAEICATVALVRDPALHWDSLLDAAEATGMLGALSSHLHHVGQIYQDAFGRRLLRAPVRRRLVRGRWGVMEFRGGTYGPLAARVAAGLYLTRLGTAIARGEWDAAARVCLLPMVAAGTAWRRVTHPMTLDGV